MAGITFKIGLEIRDRYAVGVGIVNAQSASNVNNVNAYIMLLHLLLDVVDAITQGFKIAHVKYL